MEYDRDKVDELTLALLYLVSSPDASSGGARCWRGFEQETLQRLIQKGWIKPPETRSISLEMTNEGYTKARELFSRNFVCN